MTFDALARARRALMGVPEKQILAFKSGEGERWDHLEAAVRAAVGGYNAVVDGGDLGDVMARVDLVPNPLRGYAYEGVAMGLTGLDLVLPGPSRLQAFLAGPGDGHVYMSHIGAGEALARLRRRPESYLARLEDPVLRWLVLDGYGFHQGFFARQRFVDRQEVPRFLSPFGKRIFDQGVGRSIWFTSGANVERTASELAAFAPDRHADLWVGVGVACSYVGGLPRADVVSLRLASGGHLPSLATGAAFAARGRHRAGNVIPDMDMVCGILCDTNSADAAALVQDGFDTMPATTDRPGYELLLAHLRAAFSPLPLRV